ncbi:hypothetical protein D1872_269600 [compost metagenome]
MDGNIFQRTVEIGRDNIAHIFAKGVDIDIFIFDLGQFEQIVGSLLLFVFHDIVDHIDKVALIFFGDTPHHPKVDEREPPVVEGEDITGVWIGVKKAVYKDLFTQ